MENNKVKVFEIKGSCKDCRFRKEFFDEWNYRMAWCCSYPDKEELYRDNKLKSDEEFIKIKYCNKFEEPRWYDNLIKPLIIIAIMALLLNLPDIIKYFSNL